MHDICVSMKNKMRIDRNSGYVRNERETDFDSAEAPLLVHRREGIEEEEDETVGETG